MSGGESLRASAERVKVLREYVVTLLEDRCERGEGDSVERETVRLLHEAETSMRAERIGVESEMHG